MSISQIVKITACLHPKWFTNFIKNHKILVLIRLCTLTSVHKFSALCSHDFLWYLHNFSKNKELLESAIISFILMTLVFDSVVILMPGDATCLLSFIGVTWLWIIKSAALKYSQYLFWRCSLLEKMRKDFSFYWNFCGALEGKWRKFMMIKVGLKLAFLEQREVQF